MHQEYTVKAHEDRDLVTIEIAGCLTASAEKAMDEAYQVACAHNPKNILLRFDGKNRINSVIIASVINLVIGNQEEGRRIFATGLSKHSRKVFQLAGLTRYTTIVESEQDIGRQ